MSAHLASAKLQLPLFRRLLLIAALGLSAIGIGSTTAEAAPSRFYQNTVYNTGYMGCAFALHHGQYGNAAFASLKNNDSGSGCVNFNTFVVDTVGQIGNLINQANPVDGVTYQSTEIGTESYSYFSVRGTKFGLTCTIQLRVNPNGTYSVSLPVKNGGTGTCPTGLAF